jgi:formamidopyrimidine-DNA glycosylase
MIMPELPEVQTIVDELKAAALEGERVLSARVFWPRSVAVPSASRFENELRGRTIAAIRRRAKYIVWDLKDGGALLIHLRMTGHLHLASADEPHSAYERAVFRFARARELRLDDTRKFARLYLLQDAQEVLGSLGLEPLSPAFTRRVLASKLAARAREIKPLLLDQTFVAGLGNIYVDEALWEAGIHPRQKACAITGAKAAALHTAIRRVLRRGISNLGTTLGTGAGNYYSVSRRRGNNGEALNVFRRTGLPCPRCSTPVQRLVVAQRGTHICAACQPLIS